VNEDALQTANEHEYMRVGERTFHQVVLMTCWDKSVKDALQNVNEHGNKCYVVRTLHQAGA